MNLDNRPAASGYFSKRFAFIVGNRIDAHPSFLEAYMAGIVVTWVKDIDELCRLMGKGATNDLIVLDTRFESDHQCAVCRALMMSGRRVICIGCSLPECSPCHIRERDLLSAMLAAAVAYPPPTTANQGGGPNSKASLR